nr:MAG TPA: hypothetical protein [Caudoviricetes sp.]
MGTENVADASHGQWRRSCIFCAAVVNGKASWPSPNRTAVTKEDRSPAAQKLGRHRQR